MATRRDEESATLLNSNNQSDNEPDVGVLAAMLAGMGGVLLCTVCCIMLLSLGLYGWCLYLIITRWDPDSSDCGARIDVWLLVWMITTACGFPFLTCVSGAVYKSKVAVVRPVVAILNMLIQLGLLIWGGVWLFDDGIDCRNSHRDRALWITCVVVWACAICGCCASCSSSFGAVVPADKTSTANES